MKKCIIVYYSQHGTTEKTADSIAEGIKSRGYRVDSFNIKKEFPPGLSGYDLLVVGSPVYYFRPAYNILGYLEKLNIPDSMPVAVFLMYGTYSFNAYSLIRKILLAKGARIIGYDNYTGDDLYLGYLKEGYLFSPDHPDSEERAKAEEFGKNLIDACENGSEMISAGEIKPGLVYLVEKTLFHKWLIRNFHSRFFRINRQRCSSCGLCVQNCPTDNIREDADKKITWGKDCLFCLSCELKCPQNAISSTADWFIVKPFMRYNTRKAASDPDLDHVRVEHVNGRVKIR